jgi:hypothetical protein
MPWQGNAEISIDRFDVRAHLDYIAEVQIEENTYPEVSTKIWILLKSYCGKNEPLTC